MQRLSDGPTPTIAAVDGPVRAGGIGLMAACDLVVVKPSITFAFTEVRIGVAPAIIRVPILARCGWSMWRPVPHGRTVRAPAGPRHGTGHPRQRRRAGHSRGAGRGILAGAPTRSARRRPLCVRPDTRSRSGPRCRRFQRVAVPQRRGAEGMPRSPRSAARRGPEGLTVSVLPDRVIAASDGLPRQPRGDARPTARSTTSNSPSSTRGGGRSTSSAIAGRGKMLVRERIEALLDIGSPFLELSPLAAWGTEFPVGAGTVDRHRCRRGRRVHDHRPTTRRYAAGRATRITMRKNLRAYEIARENRLPMVNLVESGGADLPTQSEIFIPGGRELPRHHRAVGAAASRPSPSCSATPPPAARTCRA